ncbi:Spi family protease inhibitor [Prevotella ihumii]|uniref:Spi family protease inhibitor n=1 Tax=Prevotella ihumii TaxID=1917878 RepID=UPI000980A533|nr:Spi family protease inhibitor [Prevotella ihumii]
MANEPQSRANDKLTEFADNFYVVTFENEHGYAIVSKDKRTFPVYAVLDSGRFKKNILQEAEMQHHIQNMIAGNNKEIQDCQKEAQQYKAMCTTRGNNDKPALNTENAIQERHSMKNGEM